MITGGIIKLAVEKEFQSVNMSPFKYATGSCIRNIIVNPMFGCCVLIAKPYSPMIILFVIE